jgi:WD40 repeat protein
MATDGKHTVAVGCDDKTVRVYDRSLNPIAKLTGHTDIVKSVAFGPNGRLASGGHGGVLEWDANYRLIDQQNIAGVQAVAYHSGRVVTSTFADRRFSVCVVDGKCLRGGNGTIDNESICRGKVHAIGLQAGRVVSVAECGTLVRGSRMSVTKGQLRCLAVIDDRRVACGGSESVIFIVDTMKMQVTEKLTGHSGTVTGLAWAGALFSSGYDCEVRRWDNFK